MFAVIRDSEARTARYNPGMKNLSASVVTVPRFEIRGWKSKDLGRRLPAYHELAAAGIMEPVPISDSECRFTEDGRERREEILREAEESQLERRPHQPDRVNLSDEARRLLGGVWWPALRDLPLLRRRDTAVMANVADSLVEGDRSYACATTPGDATPRRRPATARGL